MNYKTDRYARACLAEAIKGKSELRFGSVLVKKNKIIGRGRNKLATAEERQKMKYVDYCIHSEQSSILDAIDNGHNVEGTLCYVFGYVASGKYKGTFTIRDKPVFGCKRCPHTFLKYNISVMIPHIEGWVKLSPEQARDTAAGIQGIWTNFVKTGKVENLNE